jgi:hypothetical protein
MTDSIFEIRTSRRIRKLATISQNLMTRYVVAVVSVLALAVLGCVAVTGSASASTIHGCPVNSFCLYPQANFGGEFTEFPAGSYRQCHFNQFPNGLDNSASSMVNNTGRYVTLYRNDGCGGDTYVAKPNSVDSTFSNNTTVGGNFDNKASGLAFH